MKLEIDQSGKIEQTEKDTILCLSNKKRYSLKISRKIKRKIQKLFRSNNLIRNFIIYTHSAGISILLKKVKLFKKVIIDLEYSDKSHLIKDIILKMSAKTNFKPIIEFRCIGKNSRADYFAGLIAKKLLKPTWIVSYEEILSEIKRTEVGKRLKNA